MRATQSQGRVVSVADAGRVSPEILGGKAANLLRLGGAGLPVPPWLCVTTEVWAEIARPLAGEIAALSTLSSRDRDAIKRASATLGDAVRGSALPAEDARTLEATFDALFGAGARVAVRSSVVGEDSGEDSFAGQMDTYLHVRRADLVGRVLACLASTFSERALLYRVLRGKLAAPVRAAVLVQLMVESEASGVLFTTSPTGGEGAVISAGLGLGEGIVAGLVETDTLFVNLGTGKIQHQAIGDKRTKIARDGESGTRTAEVDPRSSAEPALSAIEVARLCDAGRRIEALYGAPQDIEFAFDARRDLYILQARQITTLGRGRESIFDNSNVVESYPGLSSPLTFSYVRMAYATLFRHNSLRAGAPAKVVSDAEAVYQNLVALVDGRVYYNILNWYRLFQLVPGFEWALPAWEKALGLEKRLKRPVLRSIGQRLQLLPAQLRATSRVLYRFWRLGPDIASFFRELASVQEVFASRELSSLDAHELLELVEMVSRRILPAYVVSIGNDAIGQQLHELLGQLITRYGLGDPGELRNDLLCGESGMESVAPLASALALTDRIRADARLRALFESKASPVEVIGAIPPGDFRDALDEHFEKYGDRVLCELKLETVPAGENPDFVVTTLRNFLRGSQRIGDIDAREHAIRSRAEKTIEEKLAMRPFARFVFGRVLTRLRRAVRDRENLRLARSRSFGLVRRVYRELGRRFVAGRMLDDAADIFHLTTDEVAGAVRGQSVTRDLRALVVLRRGEYAQLKARRPDPRITTFGIVYQSTFESPPEGPSAGGSTLTGVGAGGGRATAPAKVLLDPASDLEVSGEILIAPTTDPGWVFLMAAAGGLVSEKGSLLSHTAIIGRELGIPTVVGVKDATRLIASGQRITLDGARGTVELHRDRE